MRQVERDVEHALEGLDLDFGALLAVSNIFRAATAVRTRIEGTVLAEHELSWSAFVTLFVLRVWGPQESHRLADEVGITAGTLTGVVKSLEARQMVKRAPHRSDGRKVIVEPTTKGRKVVDQVMPRFNAIEADVTSDLTLEQRTELTDLLRTVLRTIDGDEQR
jgi:MarR family transcriptional regulator, organic hydroperoxide resistance regulator